MYCTHKVKYYLYRYYMQANRKSVTDHIGYLDSARGIASLMVLVYHFINWRYQGPDIKVANIFVHGDNAVSFFFVLSGFVLSYKYLVLGHSLDLRNFVVSRLFRLWPGFVVAVLSMAYVWNIPIDLAKLKDIFVDNNQEIYQELFLFRSRTRFYGPGWTLAAELLMSMLIPVMVIVAKKGRIFSVLLMAGFLIAGNGMISYFLVSFSLGVVLAAYYYYISDDSFKRTKWFRYRWFILPFGILLFILKPIHELSPLGITLVQALDYLKFSFYLISGIGAFILLGALIRSQKAQKVFDIGILRFYGRISYGIYLIHWAVISLIFRNWESIVIYFPSDKAAFVVMLFVCLAVSTLLATIIYYTVELPFIRYGKRVVRKLKPSLVIE